MSGTGEADDRALSASEQELVEASQQPALAGQSKDELRALGGRLREARDRARAIARRQRREMRGKAEPRGIRPARDNTGTLAKADVLVAALRRVTMALRKLNAPTQSEIARKALALKRAARGEPHPDGGRTARKGLRPKDSKKPTVRMDPREIGRVSQAGKRAQARRDSGGGR